MTVSRIERVPRRMTQQSSIDVQIKMYTKQKEHLMKRIDKLRDNERLTPEEKSTSIYGIKKAIQDLNTQIEQLQLQKIQEMSMKPEYINQDEERDELLREQAEELGVVYTPSMSGVLHASQSMRTSKTIKRSQTKLDGEIRIAESEANSRTSPSKTQAQRLPKLRSVKATNDHQLVDVYLEVNEQIEKDKKRASDPKIDHHKPDYVENDEKAGEGKVNENEGE